MKKILIIEDELAYVTVLRDRLQHDYSVLYALDGYTGLHMALTEKPQLILVDIHLPRFDGGNVIQELRKDTYGRKAKILVLTNIEPDHTAMRRIAEGLPVGFFIKSNITLNDLLHVIHGIESPE